MEGPLSDLVSNLRRDSALARNGASQSKARGKPKAKPSAIFKAFGKANGAKPQVDNTTQRLIDQAKARSAANTTPAAAPEPMPSVTGEFTYKTSAGGSNIEAELDKVYGGKVPDFLKDAKKDAARIYAPVMSDLDAQGRLARNNSASNTKQLNSMYSALGKNISAEDSAIVRRTDAGLTATRANTAKTVDAVGDNFSRANTEVADLMRSLGLEAAAGDTLPKGAEHQAFIQGLVQNEGQGAANLTKQLGRNARDFNSAQKNIAGFEGAQNVASNQKNLASQLAQLATTRASIGSQQAGQASSMASQLRGEYTNSLNAKANALVNSYAQQQQMEIARMNAQAGITSAQITAEGNARAAASKSSSAGQPSIKQQYDMTDPGTKLFATAAQLFGTSGDAASRAVAFANHVASSNASKLDAKGRNTGDNRFPTAARFAEAVTASNSKLPPEKRLSNDKLLALAYAMFPNL